jgi:hypothetical protein
MQQTEPMKTNEWDRMQEMLWNQFFFFLPLAPLVEMLLRILNYKFGSIIFELCQTQLLLKENRLEQLHPQNPLPQLDTLNLDMQ